MLDAQATDEAVALEALRRGELHGVIEALMDLYGRAIYRYSCRMVGDPDLADDVLQMTFLQAYQHLPGFTGLSSLRVWLFGIAKHRCLDALKARRRRRWRFPAISESAPDPSAPTNEDAVGGNRIRVALAGCLRSLKESVRTAVLLRYEGEFSYAEMAEICGEQAATLQARVARALPLLKRCLEQQGLAI